LHDFADPVPARVATASSTAFSAPVHPIVIRLGRLGDMVLLSPLLNLLHRRYRMPCWLIGAGLWSFQLYRDNPDVARVWSFAGRHTPLLLGPTWWRVLWALRYSGRSPIYVCETATTHQLERIKWLLALAGVGHERCVFLQDENWANGNEHRVDCLLRFARRSPSSLQAAEYSSPDVRPAPRIHVLDEERLECAAWIRSQGWSGRPIVLIQPGNRQSMRHRRWRAERIDDKAWSLSKWAELLCLIRISLPKVQILLCGSRWELTLLEKIRSVSGFHDVVALHLPLRRLFPLCEVAHSMISVDTGPAHVAAAMGSPLVVLFGNSSPRHWLPRSFCGSPVIGLGGAPGFRHVNQISVQAVFEAWRSLPPVPSAKEAGERLLG
jgi:heptosyltransferase-2/heptosyltransferase-3